MERSVYEIRLQTPMGTKRGLAAIAREAGLLRTRDDVALTSTQLNELSDDEVVRVKEIEFAPLTEEEALVQIDLLGHDFFAYTDRDTNLVNVLYRRDNGGYGLLKQKE